MKTIPILLNSSHQEPIPPLLGNNLLNNSVTPFNLLLPPSSIVFSPLQIIRHRLLRHHRISIIIHSTYTEIIKNELTGYRHAEIECLRSAFPRFCYFAEVFYTFRMAVSLLPSYIFTLVLSLRFLNYCGKKKDSDRRWVAFV